MARQASWQTWKYHPSIEATEPRVVFSEALRQRDLSIQDQASFGWKVEVERDMAKLPTDLHITYQLQFRKCGKPSCGTCKRGPGHGPYWYAYWREGNKLRSGYIGKVQPNGVPASVIARAEARLALAPASVAGMK